MQSLTLMVSNFVRTKPRLGRFLIGCIPDFERSIDVKEIGKFRIRNRKHRYLWLRDPLGAEGFFMAAFRLFVPKGGCVYNLGANIGLYDRLLVSVFGAGRVVSFEPMHSNLDLFNKNLALGGIQDRVTLVEAAVADADGEADFQIDDLTTVSSTLSRVSGGNAAAARKQYGLAPITQKVRMVSLDSVIEKESLPRPDVIKIDVEGAEDLVISGAERTIRSVECPLIIEFHGLDTVRKTLEKLVPLGYQVFGYAKNGKDDPRTYRQITLDSLASMTNKYSVHHVVAVKKPRDIEVARVPIPMKSIPS